MSFAKLFETDEGSQILVVKQEDELGQPQHLVMFETNEGLTIENKVTFETFEAADRAFDIVDRELAIRFRRKSVALLGGLSGG